MLTEHRMSDLLGLKTMHVASKIVLMQKQFQLKMRLKLEFLPNSNILVLCWTGAIIERNGGREVAWRVFHNPTISLFNSHFHFLS